MKAVQIIPDVYWVGALHPDLRVFDILMHTKNGTSYNSYLIQDEKTAIIDTVMDKFTQPYLQWLSELTDLQKIDYIIVQHNEMDHSGSLAELLEAAPKATILCPKPAIKYVQNVINREARIKPVENGEVLDLGGKKIEFITAPFLHWPDTMMSYLSTDGILFTCDLLAAHFCDSHLFNDLISRDVWPDFKYYFDIIFRPLKKHVRNGLKKIEGKSLKIVAPSHGPILRADLDKYIQAYLEWSAPLPENQPKKLVIYYATAHGNTERMARRIALGAQEQGMSVEVFDAADIQIEEHLDRIESADVIVFGSPTINGDAVPPIWHILNNLGTIEVKGKLGASFGSMGWSGEATGFIDRRLSDLKFKVPLPGLQAVLVPGEEELKKCFEFGVALAQGAIQS